MTIFLFLFKNENASKFYRSRRTKTNAAKYAASGILLSVIRIITVPRLATSPERPSQGKSSLSKFGP